MRLPRYSTDPVNTDSLQLLLSIGESFRFVHGCSEEINQGNVGSRNEFLLVEIDDMRSMNLMKMER